MPYQPILWSMILWFSVLTPVWSQEVPQKGHESEEATEDIVVKIRTMESSEGKSVTIDFPESFAFEVLGVRRDDVTLWQPNRDKTLHRWTIKVSDPRERLRVSAANERQILDVELTADRIEEATVETTEIPAVVRLLSGDEKNWVRVTLDSVQRRTSSMVVRAKDSFLEQKAREIFDQYRRSGYLRGSGLFEYNGKSYAAGAGLSYALSHPRAIAVAGPLGVPVVAAEAYGTVGNRGIRIVIFEHATSTLTHRDHLYTGVDPVIENTPPLHAQPRRRRPTR